MSIQQNQIVQPTYNGQDIYYRTPVDAIITDGMSLDDYIRNTTGVVESGENSNGRYIKFADGTMICQGSKTFTSVVCTIGYGGLYRSTASNQMDDFPVEFYDVPVVNFGVTDGASSGSNGSTGPIVVVFMKNNTDATNIYVPTRTNPGRLAVVIGASQTIPTITISYTAIGRWKAYDVSVLPDQRQSTIINSSIGTWDYQSSEHVIGIHDGRPLYRRTYKTGSLPNAQGTYYYSSGLSTECVAVNCYGMIRPNSGTSAYYFPINCGERFSTYFRQTDSNICIQINQDRSSFFAEVTVEYFKTTDAIITSQTKDILTVVNGKDISDLDTIIKQRVDQVIQESLAYDKLGKLLWAGSFTSGTLNVPGISKYKIIVIRTANLMMFGNQYYGGLAFRGYRSQGTAAYGYRYTYDAAAETLTTTTDNPGATDGANNIAITEIYGIF